MRYNEAKQHMLDGEATIGAAVGMGSALSAELLSLIGFDHVLVDMQHGAYDDEDAMLAFRSILLGSAVPMARVRQNDYYAIGRLLDRGALGIVVPMVNSVEEAQAAAYAVRYPPRGGRSIGSFGALMYGSDYLDWIDDEVFLAVQIESAGAVEIAEDILEVPGVDGCWIGPADLAASMGVDPETPVGREARDAAILSVLEACRSAGKIPGIAAGTADDAERWIEEGFLFVTAIIERLLLRTAAREVLTQLGRA